MTNSLVTRARFKRLLQPTIWLWKTLLFFALAHVLFVSPVAAEEKAVLDERSHQQPSEAQRPLFEFLRVKEAWKELGDAEGCLVGIVDGGFDFFHPCLDGSIEPTFFAGGVFHNGSSRETSHGTGMASLIAAQRVDENGMVGLAPRSKLLAASMGSVRHLPSTLRAAYLREHPGADPAALQEEMQRHAPELQAFPRIWIGSKVESAADGIVALVDAGARVINLSSHFDERTMSAFPDLRARLDTAYAHAEKHDVLIVVSAGNTGAVETVYPGTSETVLVVGASLLNDELWEQEWQQGDRVSRMGSCTGPRLSVVAPVEKLVTANPHDEASYKFINGPFGDSSGTFAGPYSEIPRGATSQAAPIVASLAALIRSARPDLSTKEVIAVIQDSAVDLGEPGRDDRFGHGRIDFLAALRLVREQ